MREPEWASCQNPQKMLQWLQHHGATDRKLRLFACACVRRAWPLLVDPRSRAAVEIAERHAEGLAGDAELERAHHDAQRAYWEVSASYDWAAERRAQAGLLRDLFGNVGQPHRAEPRLLRWEGGLLPLLAKAAYAERVLPAGTLDPACVGCSPTRWRRPGRALSCSSICGGPTHTTGDATPWTP